jgi:hypothetical protein
MSQGKRYKFQGSSFQVQTGFGSSAAITAITAANPPVVTSAGHGREDGDVVLLSGIAGPTQYNGTLQIVDDALTGSYELAGVDASEYPAFVLASPNLALAQPVLFSDFCELTGVNQQDGAADEIEVTTICSTAKEFELGLSDSGTVQLDFNWAGNEAVQAALRAAKRAGEEVALRLTFPGTGGVVIMIGFVQQTSFQGAVNGVWTASATIRLTGDIAVLEA